jgi:hypothetical protein
MHTDHQGETAAEAAIGLGFSRSLYAGSAPELFCQVQYLPACRDCGTKHPLAFNPPHSAEKCPACGASTGPLEPVQAVPPVLTGYRPSSLLARGLLAIGQALNAVAGRL